MSLNQIHEFHELFVVQSWCWCYWKQMVDTSIPHGVVPPVLTNNFDVTIGGTHSAAGLGQNSFRHGSQADNCLGLSCNRDREIWFGVRQKKTANFSITFCGYGQFGIITQIQHRLRWYRFLPALISFCYDDLDFLEWWTSACIRGLRRFVSIFIFPCVMRISRAGEMG